MSTKAKAKEMAKRVAEADKRQAHRATRAIDGPLATLAGRASELADQPPLIVLSVATIVAGAALRHPAVLRTGARMLASHLVATGVKTILKNMIDRTRPSRSVERGYYAGKGDGADDSSLNSFPSGHTAGAVAVAQAVAAESRPLALPLQAAAIGVGALQPSRGKHYASDVLAGAAIGWASERLVDAGWRWAAAVLRTRRAPDAEEEAAAHPS